MAKKNQKDLKIKPLETDGIFQVTLGTILFAIAAISVLIYPNIFGENNQASALRITIFGVILGIFGLFILFRRKNRLKIKN
mgnify:CR=1 FL=1